MDDGSGKVVDEAAAATALTASASVAAVTVVPAAAGSNSNPPGTGRTKDRHIVTWTPEEDKLLREQVEIHGTENNWTSIAAQFKDKTGRQCRRRWFTYLNTECKKGGWSPEEDMLLCEAQRIYGNRWTEIAKVVSGRTDNAVKNRFNTLCKKRAKQDQHSKENGNSLPAYSESSAKRARYNTLNAAENQSGDDMSLVRSGNDEKILRHPLAAINPNLLNIEQPSPAQNVTVNNSNFHPEDDLKVKLHGHFLKRNDPKVAALMQQADLLTSLAQKIKTDNSEESLEDAWKELRDYLIKTGDCESFCNDASKFDLRLVDFKDLLEDLTCCSSENDQSLRQSDFHSSQANSEHSIGGICTTSVPDKIHINEACSNPNSHPVNNICEEEDVNATDLVQVSPLHEPEKMENGDSSTFSITEFNSPLNVVPPFQSFEEIVPSPKFSASERNFLLSVIGLSSPSSDVQQPSCKRALLQNP